MAGFGYEPNQEILTALMTNGSAKTDDLLAMVGGGKSLGEIL